MLQKDLAQTSMPTQQQPDPTCNEPLTDPTAYEYLCGLNSPKASRIISIIESGLTVCPQTLATNEPMPCFMACTETFETLVDGVPECAGCLHAPYPFSFEKEGTPLGVVVNALDEIKGATLAAAIAIENI